MSLTKVAEPGLGGSCVDWNKLERTLQHHDWFYAYSDDGGVWRRGQAAFDQLKRELDDAATISPEWVNTMWDRYAPPQFIRPFVPETLKG
jgi:hypothetical protein